MSLFSGVPIFCTLSYSPGVLKMVIKNAQGKAREAARVKHAGYVSARFADGPIESTFGEVPPAHLAPVSFDPSELLTSTSDTIPAWQRDNSDNAAAFLSASLERKSVLKSISQINRCGVIFDKEGRILFGTLGWRNQLANVATLAAEVKKLTPISMQSQKELASAISLLFDDHALASVPVALRDLDGWVSDLVHIQRVGRANPDYAFTLLPKSLADIAANAACLTMAMKLTKCENALVVLIVRGLTEREMASELELKPGQIRRSLAELTAKFRVRQSNDIARLMMSFP